MICRKHGSVGDTELREDNEELEGTWPSQVRELCESKGSSVSMHGKERAAECKSEILQVKEHSPQPWILTS